VGVHSIVVASAIFKGKAKG